MSDQARYYKIVGRGRIESDPSGLARRVNDGEETKDESLRRDLTWGPTSAIAEWERGEELTRDLIEIHEAEAQVLIEGFRKKWSSQE